MSGLLAEMFISMKLFIETVYGKIGSFFKSPQEDFGFSRSVRAYILPYLLALVVVLSPVILLRNTAPGHINEPYVLFFYTVTCLVLCRHLLAIPSMNKQLTHFRKVCDSLTSDRQQAIDHALKMEQIANEHKTVHEKLEESNQILEQTNARLESLATTDGMTGLANHRAFQELLAKEKARSDREGLSLALLLLDVDHFKDFNDTFGHPAGDELLRQFAKLLQEKVRVLDHVARYGGEEFGVILPNCSSDDAMKLAERLRSAIAIHEFPHRSITVSIGVAYYPEENENYPNVIERADRALYVAKMSGRNRVAFSDEILEEEAAIKSGDGTDSSSNMLQRAQFAPPDSTQWGQLEGLVQQSAGQLLPQIHALIEMRNAETDGHSQRIARFALRLAREAAANGDITLDPGDLQELTYGALLHDIGKLALPMNILMKRTPLDAFELELISKHPELGVQLLERFPLLSPALPVVRSHHERWDGLGFPDGLKGDEIPVSARLIALTGALDVMWTDQYHKKALTFEEICEKMDQGSGTQFDPKLVNAFRKISMEEWAALRQKDDSEQCCYLPEWQMDVQLAA